MRAEPITIGGERVEPGERVRLEIPVARLTTETWVSLPAEVVCGRRAGPRLWLSAAVHGDEINGIEIIRRVLEVVDEAKLRGAVVAVPIVNVFGVINQSRYLPDRRDLNRCFPGSARGSLASRLAHLFMTEIVAPCTHGIDLHTGSNHRTNLPQVRANLEDEETRRLARAFGAPVMMHAKTVDGSLRQAAAKRGKTALLYEAGEPLRFDEKAIGLGVDGVLRVLAELGMQRASKKRRQEPPVEVEKSRWVRARRSGIMRLRVTLGEQVAAKQVVAEVSDAFGEERTVARAPFAGVILGHTNNPLVHQGDAVVHVGKTAGG